MSFTLGDEDRRAVDMLLDRDGTHSNGNGNGGDGNGGSHGHAAAAKGGQFHQRIQRVEQILAVLTNMPAGDPPQNLVARVLERLEEQPVSRAPSTPAAQPAIDATRPLA